MSSFAIHGPFKIAHEKRNGGERALVFKEFWKEESEASYLSSERGCYVFAIRTGGGFQPIYVGKATKTFKQEAFNPTNKHKYQDGFSDYAIGTPIMYFIVHPSKQGPTNVKYVGQIEEFLVQAGVAKNPDLQNVKGTQRPKWSIKGVIRSGVGRRSKAEVQFGALFDIRRK